MREKPSPPHPPHELQKNVTMRFVPMIIPYVFVQKLRFCLLYNQSNSEFKTIRIRAIHGRAGLKLHCMITDILRPFLGKSITDLRNIVLWFPTDRAPASELQLTSFNKSSMYRVGPNKCNYFGSL